MNAGNKIMQPAKYDRVGPVRKIKREKYYNNEGERISAKQAARELAQACDRFLGLRGISQSFGEFQFGKGFQ